MKENTILCKFCSKTINNIAPDWLECIVCKQSIHLLCLKRQCTPGAIEGDVFFNLTCIECSDTKAEKFVRQKMTWFQVVVLVMYHLHNKTFRNSNRGFFHWKSHLVSFIDQRWNVLFPKDFKRKKNWIGTISGSLSHYSPTFLTSGMQYLGESGWWRLTFPKLTPKLMYIIHNEFIANKHYQNKVENESVYILKLIAKHAPHILSEISIPEKKSYLGNDDECSDNIDIDSCEFTSFNEQSESENTVKLHHDYKVTHALEDTNCFSSEIKSIAALKKIKKIKTHFTNSASTSFCNFWKEIGQLKAFNSCKIVPLQSCEEEFLLDYVNWNCNRDAHVFKRKLEVRSLKRKHGLQFLNADETVKPVTKVYKKDRFSHYGGADYERRLMDIRIASGNMKCPNGIISPYTHRLLKPYIRRDFDTQYSWPQLMAELQLRVNSKYQNWKLPPRYPVDFCYVRPHHIAAINSLCERFFWPGIDLAETLEYPDFTCVAMYRRLVIGFAFMVPDVKFNETYISFIFTLPGWRNCGLGKFMIYHLIQTCYGKEVTLHVAVDNPAIFLYQKFGFKVEKVLFNFYETYLRDDSNHCKHAFFMRLDR